MSNMNEEEPEADQGTPLPNPYTEDTVTEDMEDNVEEDGS